MDNIVPLLEVTDLNVFYGGIQAIRNLSLHVDTGEIVSIIGSNGAGKSTFLRAVAGDLPFKGDIKFDGKKIPNTAYKVVEMGISLVPEGRRIFPNLSVFENMMVGAYRRHDKLGIKHDLEEIYTLFPILEKRKKQMGGSLSGGEQQMLALGRALIGKPKLLLLDEPSLGLAPIIVDELFDKIIEINRAKGLTLILVEQNAYLALEVAHRAYVINTGAITIEGTGEQLFNNPRVIESYLGAKGV